MRRWLCVLRAPVVLVAMVVAGGGLAAGRAVGQETPFEGVVVEDNAEVFSGAGKQFYTMGTVPRGTVVTVDDMFAGWYKIVPPAGVFSYISKGFVDAKGDGAVGVVNKDHAEVKAGSIKSPGDSWRNQVFLKQGDLVEIQGEEGSYYKIAPPRLGGERDAFVYLRPDAVRRRAAGEATPAVGAPGTGTAGTGRTGFEGLGTAAGPRPASTATTAGTGTAHGSAAGTASTGTTGAAATSGGAAGTRAVALGTASVATVGTAGATGTASTATRPASGTAGTLGAGGTPGVLGTAGAAATRSATRPAGTAATGTASTSLTFHVPTGFNGERPTTRPADAGVSGTAVSETGGTRTLRPTSPTLQGLETRLEEARRLPLEQQPLRELIAGYEAAQREPNLGITDRRIAAYRLAQLRRSAEIASALGSVQEIQQRVGTPMTMPAPAPTPPPGVYDPSRYDAVGQLLASNVFDGTTSPRLFRLVDPANGRTISYVLPNTRYDPQAVLGKVVGVTGATRYDPALKLQILNPTQVQALRPASETAGEGESRGGPPPADTGTTAAGPGGVGAGGLAVPGAGNAPEAAPVEK